MLGQLTVRLEPEDQLALTWLTMSYADIGIQVFGRVAILASSIRTADELGSVFTSVRANEALLARAKVQRDAMLSELLL